MAKALLWPISVKINLNLASQIFSIHFVAVDLMKMKNLSKPNQTFPLPSNQTSLFRVATLNTWYWLICLMNHQ